MHAMKLLVPVTLMAGAALLASLAAARPNTPASAPGAGAAVATAAATYEIDKVHSSVVFRVMHLGTAWVYGRFNDFKGTIHVDAGEPGKSSIEVEIDASSVDTASKNRDEHIRSPDFLDAKQFPELRFKSTEVKALGGDRYQVTGDITLRGKTETVSFEVEQTGTGKNRRGQNLIGFHGTLQIDRMAHGISYMPEGLGTTVDVIVSFEAAEQ